MGRRGILGLVLVLVVSAVFAPARANAATQEQINAALNKGVEWTATQQDPDGKWNVSRPVGSTGLALAVLGHYAHRLGDTPLSATFPYRDNMQNGLNYIFSQTYRNEGDGRVWFGSTSINSADNYVLGPAIMGIVMSGTPDRVVDVPGSAVNGMTYRNVVQEIVNYAYYSQCTTGGGIGSWAYNGQSTYGDQSIAGWVTLGLGYARDRFGIVLQQDMMDRLNTAIDIIQWTEDAGDPRYGGIHFSRLR